MSGEQKWSQEVQTLLETLLLEGEEEQSWDETFGMFHAALEQAPNSEYSWRDSPSSEQIELVSLSTSYLPEISIDLNSTTSPSHIQLEPQRSSELADIQLRRLLGKGGIGEVFLAKQHSLQRSIAIKRVRAECKDDLKKNSLLLREGLLMGFLEHPNIVPVHILGRDREGYPLLIMKRIEGVSWRTLMYDDTHPMWKTLRTSSEDTLQCHLNILSEVCRALEFAHSRGVIHCDVKPENVMIGSFGEVYLLDWGIAQIQKDAQSNAVPVQTTSKRRLFGTPAYMAPEMVQGCFTQKTDVYLLGATLHEVLTHQTKHLGESLREVLFSIVASPPVEYKTSVPADLARLCNDATHPDPEHRVSDVRSFRLALDSYAQHKASYTLEEEARSRLDAFKQELQAVHETGAESSALHKLFTECRFGFLQSLREWKDNERAQEGLQSCLEAMLLYQIQNERLQAAEILLVELPTVRPELEKRVEELRSLISERAAREHEYQLHLHEQDFNVSKKQRGFSVLLIAVLAGLIPSIVRAIFQWEEYSHILNMTGLVSISLGIAVIFFLLRRSLFQNDINRIFVSYIGMSLFFIWIHRLVSFFKGIEPKHTLAVDFLFMGVLGFAYASRERVFWGFGCVFFIGFCIGAIWPMQLKWVYMGSMFSACAIYFYLFRGQADVASSKHENAKSVH